MEGGRIDLSKGKPEGSVPRPREEARVDNTIHFHSLGLSHCLREGGSEFVDERQACCSGWRVANFRAPAERRSPPGSEIAKVKAPASSSTAARTPVRGFSPARV